MMVEHLKTSATVDMNNAVGAIKFYKTMNLIFAGVALLGSVLTGAWVGGMIVGHVEADIQNLTSKVQSLDVSLGAANANIIGLQVEEHDLSSALAREHEERLDGERMKAR